MTILTGVAYPKEFKYTGNAKTNTAPFASTVIVYKPTQYGHVSTSYIYGFKSEVSRIIDSIIINVSGKEQYKYKFKYVASENTERDLLKSIQRLGADNLGGTQQYLTIIC